MYDLPLVPVELSYNNDLQVKRWTNQQNARMRRSERNSTHHSREGRKINGVRLYPTNQDLSVGQQLMFEGSSNTYSVVGRTAKHNIVLQKQTGENAGVYYITPFDGVVEQHQSESFFVPADTIYAGTIKPLERRHDGRWNVDYRGEEFVVGTDLSQEALYNEFGEPAYTKKLRLTGTNYKGLVIRGGAVPQPVTVV